MDRVIAVTPAGRRGYLELLAHYVMADGSITEWHLWDNCRLESDRAYINELAGRHEKIKIITLPQTDGHNISINRFYRFCNEPQSFYIKLDDDLVYLPPELGARLLRKAAPDRQQYLWWSPLVINNALCTWMLKYLSDLTIPAKITAQAACPAAWRSPIFAKHLHMAFIQAIRDGDQHAFQVPDQSVSLSRFSINCIGFFGEDVIKAGEGFCPPGVDDEEWISAVLPAKLGRPGRVIGDCTVAHFSYYTQEADLLKTNVLEDYYQIAGLQLTHRPVKKLKARTAAKFAILNLLLESSVSTQVAR